MKTLFLAIAMVVFLADGDVLKKDSLDQERTNIKTKTGENKGYLKRDTLDRNKINVYDKCGNQKGSLKRDTLSPDTWNLEKSDLRYTILEYRSSK